MPAGSALEVRANESLLDLLTDYSLCTSQDLIWSEKTGEQLSRSNVDLLRDVQVPIASVQYFVEGILADQEFGLLPDAGGKRVRVFAQRDREKPDPLEYLAVDPERLATLSNHTALLVRCEFETDNSAPDSTINILSRQENRFAGCEAGEEAGQLVIWGLAPKVLDWVNFAMGPGSPGANQGGASMGVEDDTHSAEQVSGDNRKLTLAAGDTSLFDFVQACMEQQDIQVCVDSDVRAKLESLAVGLLKPVTLAGKEVEPFMDSVLLLNGYASTLLLSAGPRLLRIEKSSLRELPYPVYPVLEFVGSQPKRMLSSSARGMSAACELANMDGRQIPTALRMLPTNAGLTSGSRADDGSTNFLARGPAWSARVVVDLMLAIDRDYSEQPDLSDIGLSAQHAFPTIQESLSIGESEGNLLQLVEEYAKLSDRLLWISPDAREHLESTPLDLRSAEWTGKEAQAFFDDVLRSQQMIVSSVPSTPPISAITLTSERLFPTIVDVDSLDDFADCSTLYATTLLAVRGIDVRTGWVKFRLASPKGSHRKMHVFPVANWSGVIIQGPIYYVTEMVKEMRRQDKAGIISMEAWQALGERLSP